MYVCICFVANSSGTVSPVNTFMKPKLDTAQLPCCMPNAESIDVEWTITNKYSKDIGAIIYISGDVRQQFKGTHIVNANETEGCYNLTIYNLTSKDTGEYVCRDQAIEANVTLVRLLVIGKKIILHYFFH